MSQPHHWTINTGWRILLADAGLDPANVLRRAGLPDDLFGRPKAVLDTAGYFRLWRGIEEEAADPLLPLRLGSAISVEAFDPAIFAALCSPDLNTALARIARYKRLVCPVALHVEVGAAATAVEIEWLDATARPPATLLAVELVFFVQLARLATRHRVCPLELTSPHPPEPADPYTEHFGVAVEPGPRPRIAFHPRDATRPFLTANEAMWSFFEPELQKRLAELDQAASVSDRVRAALLELLPSGAASVEAVSDRLGASTRTLQRRLQREGQSFKALLNQTREKLARHYLRSQEMTGAEISFLLGFEDPNSFFRAFHAWTGLTPAQARSAMLPAP
jgi:AraC-like DNA-binding protein